MTRNAGGASAAQSIEARRGGLVERLISLEQQLVAIRGARGDATADDEHDPEGSTLSTEWSRVEGQRADVVRELAELDAALHRVDAGTYGVCTVCGKAIAPARLEIVPAATSCVACSVSRS